MTDVHDYRRVNLLRVIEQRGGVNNVGKILGYSNGSFLTQMTGPHPERLISEKSARKYEAILELPVGALDMPVNVELSPTLVKRFVSKPSAMSAEYVTDVIMAIGQACEDANVILTPKKFAAMVSLGLDNNKPDHLSKLVLLLK